MMVRCKNDAEFFDCVYEFVTRGLTFDANKHDLSIELTGGY